MSYAKLCIGCALLFFASISVAKPLTKDWKKNVIGSLSSSTNLLDIWVAPASEEEPNKFSVFIRPTTSFQAPEELRLVLNARLDGQAVNLQTISEGFWWYQQSSLPDVGAHQFAVDFILENRTETDSIRTNITNVQKDIKDIESQITKETDDQKLDQLRAQLEDLIELEEDYQNSIADYQLLVKTESLQFEIN